ncbi:hypothetical protein ACHQM5_025280 [Ranunculus cassubicifolius]
MALERVCVTGGGGYQASWLIKLLLASKCYIVHATLREPDNEKNAHLKSLENASENLRLYKADLLDYSALLTAIEGCNGVFHVASPIQPDTVSNPEIEIIQPAVRGTSNILKACSAANVKRVVVVSSIAAVVYNPNWPKDKPMDESCWSDIETCKTAEPEYKYNTYSLAKTIAESEALEYGKGAGLEVITVCPSTIIGPMLQSAVNWSSWLIFKLLKGGIHTLENKIWRFVDVRDVAAALLLVYEKPEAQGRYICSSYTIKVKGMVDKLKSMYPDCNYPTQITEIDEGYKDLNTEKLQRLGWRYRSLEETIVDSVKNYQEKGLLE